MHRWMRGWTNREWRCVVQNILHNTLSILSHTHSHSPNTHSPDTFHNVRFVHLATATQPSDVQHPQPNHLHRQRRCQGHRQPHQLLPRQHQTGLLGTVPTRLPNQLQWCGIALCQFGNGVPEHPKRRCGLGWPGRVVLVLHRLPERLLQRVGDNVRVPSRPAATDRGRQTRQGRSQETRGRHPVPPPELSPDSIHRPSLLTCVLWEP